MQLGSSSDHAKGLRAENFHSINAMVLKASSGNKKKNISISSSSSQTHVEKTINGIGSKIDAPGFDSSVPQSSEDNSF